MVKDTLAKFSRWAQQKSSSRYATWWLFILSFGDSSVSPVPPDSLLAPLSYLQPHNWRSYAINATIASILGAILGYCLGLWFGESMLSFLSSTYNLAPQLADVELLFQQYASLSLFLAAFTPIPFKVFTISAGVFGVNFILFILVSIFGRGLRFFLVSYVAARFGTRGLDMLKKTLWLIVFFSVIYIALKLLL